MMADRPISFQADKLKGSFFVSSIYKNMHKF